jgi:hypothetical protein
MARSARINDLARNLAPDGITNFFALYIFFYTGRTRHHPLNFISPTTVAEETYRHRENWHSRRFTDAFQGKVAKRRETKADEFLKPPASLYRLITACT